MTSSRRETLLSILLIALTTALTYGALISQLGFYRDDWYLVWTSQTQGWNGMLSLFVGDRPFDGWLYAIDFSMAGVSPLTWHLYVLGIKLTSALAFFWLLRSVWENRKLETTFIALLFVVYPGYYQQPDALTAKQLLLAYAAAMLSLALTVNAVKASKTAYKILFTFLAALLSVFYILIYEAFVGIEAARILFLGYIFFQQNKNWKESVRLSLINAVPYIAFTGAFVYWRIFIFTSTRKATSVINLTDMYSSSHGLISLVVEGAKDLIETTFLAWGVPFYQFSNQAIYKETGQALALAVGVTLLGLGYYLLTQTYIGRGRARTNADEDKIRDIRVNPRPIENEADDSAPRDWLILGAMIIVVTTIPIVAAGRNVIFGQQWDRYTYQSIFGVALFMGGIIFYVVKNNLRWLLLTALILSGVMTQFFSASYYRAFWKIERDAWRQLTWRAPQIDDGTNLVVALPSGFGLAEEYEVWAPVNMIYHPKNPTVKIAGQIFFNDVWIDLAKGNQETRIVRGTISVSRDYGKSIILSQPTPQSCLHVLDGRRFEQAVTERVDVRVIAKYSNTEYIHDGVAPTPPVNVFGAEPSHGWCYYYQKMDLARQLGDWKTAADLADQATSLGLEPQDLSEWMPALEAYAHTDMKKAKRIANLIRIDKTTKVSLCAQFKSLQSEPAKYDRATLFEALCVRN